MKKIERILQFIENKGITNAEFERKTGISNGYVRNTVKTAGEIYPKQLQKMYAVYPELENIIENRKGDVCQEEKKPMPEQEPQPKQDYSTQYFDFVVKMNEHLLQVNQQLLDSQAKRDNTEAVYAQAHKTLTQEYSGLHTMLNKILSEIKVNQVSLDESNLHFSRITEAMVENQVKILDVVGHSVAHSVPAKSANVQPPYKDSSK